jgi:hypothetical protein
MPETSLALSASAASPSSNFKEASAFPHERYNSALLILLKFFLSSQPIPFNDRLIWSSTEEVENSQKDSLFQ